MVARLAKGDTMMIHILKHSPDITARHDVYEDLGIHSTSLLDPSFNVNNFGVLDLPENDASRTAQFMCSLAGTTQLTDRARELSSGLQSPHTALTGSGSGSGSHSVSPSATNDMNALDTSFAPLTTQYPLVGVDSYECAKVGLRSFSPLDAQVCPGFNMSSTDELNPEDFEFPSWVRNTSHTK